MFCVSDVDGIVSIWCWVLGSDGKVYLGGLSVCLIFFCLLWMLFLLLSFVMVLMVLTYRMVLVDFPGLAGGEAGVFPAYVVVSFGGCFFFYRRCCW